MTAVYGSLRLIEISHFYDSICSFIPDSETVTENFLRFSQESVLDKYGISKVRFDTIFAGTLPDFTVRVKRSVKHKQESIDKFLTSTVSKQKPLENADPLKKVNGSGKVNDTGAIKKFRKPR
jgi:hypothetical protein